MRCTIVVPICVFGMSYNILLLPVSHVKVSSKYSCDLLIHSSLGPIYSAYYLFSDKIHKYFSFILFIFRYFVIQNIYMKQLLLLVSNSKKRKLHVQDYISDACLHLYQNCIFKIAILYQACFHNYALSMFYSSYFCILVFNSILHKIVISQFSFMYLSSFF